MAIPYLADYYQRHRCVCWSYMTLMAHALPYRLGSALRAALQAVAARQSDLVKWMMCQYPW